ncbi:MAG TPA: hypothetical protein VH501_06590 [Solirubrobacterales bacterium]|jgi:hypothetical protein
MADLDSKYRSGLEAQLDSGEELRGVCVASQQRGMFKGGSVALGVTDRRLLVQSLNRRGASEGPPRSILPGQIASAKAGPAGGGWINVDAAILDHAAIRLEIRTTDREKLKLMLMRGEGKLLGGLGGGEPQRQGLEALAEWFRGIERT